MINSFENSCIFFLDGLELPFDFPVFGTHS